MVFGHGIEYQEHVRKKYCVKNNPKHDDVDDRREFGFLSILN
jgi:hypothetical protein